MKNAYAKNNLAKYLVGFFVFHESGRLNSGSNKIMNLYTIHPPLQIWHHRIFVQLVRSTDHNLKENKIKEIFDPKLGAKYRVFSK